MTTIISNFELFYEMDPFLGKIPDYKSVWEIHIGDKCLGFNNNNLLSIFDKEEKNCIQIVSDFYIKHNFFSLNYIYDDKIIENQKYMCINEDSSISSSINECRNKINFNNYKLLGNIISNNTFAFNIDNGIVKLSSEKANIGFYVIKVSNGYKEQLDYEECMKSLSEKVFPNNIWASCNIIKNLENCINKINILHNKKEYISNSTCNTNVRNKFSEFEIWTH
jgi:hypothetical protein